MVGLFQGNLGLPELVIVFLVTAALLACSYTRDGQKARQ